MNASGALHGRPWVTNTILVLLGFGLLAFTKQLIAEFHHFTIGFSGVAGWSVILYALAAAAVLTLPSNRFTLPLILGFAIAFRLVTLVPPPFMSTDIYRYAWDGVVQHAHISPYRYVPGDPALSFLRGPHRNLFDHINRRDYARTIYPPAAQMLFFLITWINESVTFMKLAMILFEGVTVYALIELLHALGRRREEILLYAWCPLLIWEIGSSGHLDSAVIAFIALALLARFRRQPVRTGIFLGTAILIKFYPLVLVPALWQRKDFRMPLTIAALTVVSYACYASVGWLVFGFMGGYVDEEGIQTGSRYFLMELARHLPGLHHLPVFVFLLLSTIAFAVLAYWSWQAGNSNATHQPAGLWLEMFRLPVEGAFLPGAMFLAFGMMLDFSPHYPWYLAWLIPFGVLLPNLPIFTYTLGFFYFSATSLGAGTIASQYRLNSILYALVMLAAILEWMARAGYKRWMVPKQRLA